MGLKSACCHRWFLAHLISAISRAFPDAMQTAMEQVIVAMQSSNPDAADSMERYQSKLPQLVSVITLFYYTVFGLIASAVIANYTKKGDIFTNNSI